MPKSSTASRTPARAELFEDLDRERRVAHRDRLGDLDLEVVRAAGRCGASSVADLCRERGLMELARRQVDREPQPGHERLPRADLAARRLEHPVAEADDQPAHLGARDELIRARRGPVADAASARAPRARRAARRRARTAADSSTHELVVLERFAQRFLLRRCAVLKLAPSAGVKNWCVLRPRSLARYIATSACLISASASSPSVGEDRDPDRGRDELLVAVDDQRLDRSPR